MRNYILAAFSLIVLSAFFTPAPSFAATACYNSDGSVNYYTNVSTCNPGTSLTPPDAQTINTTMDKFGNPILTPQLPAPAPIDPTVSPSAPDIKLDQRTWDQLSPAEQQFRDAANCEALGVPASECFSGSSQTGVKSSGLVQCGNPGQPSCTLCSFLELVKSLINFMMSLAFAFVGLFITWGAFVTLTAGGSEERVKEGRKILTTAITGMAIMLSAWLILGTVIQILTGSPSKLPWTEIRCTLPAVTADLPAGGAGAATSEKTLRDQLAQAGISVNKGACPTGATYQSVSGGCTSLAGVQPSTLEAAIELKKNCACNLSITGGSELGHATGPTGHASGNKLDFSLNPDLTRYIQQSFPQIATRSDGAIQYKAPDGTIYAKEGDHWDVAFR